MGEHIPPSNYPTPSDYLCDYDICSKCHFVHRRGHTYGYMCPKCGHCADSHEVYFPAAVSGLVDAIYQAQNMSWVIPVLEDRLYDFSPGSLVAIVLFSTVDEVLLDGFLTRCMYAHKIEPEERARLSQEHHDLGERFNRLFPKLVGVKWDDAVAELGKATPSCNVADVDAFRRRVRTVRNRILHEGATWSGPEERDLPKRCASQLPSLIEFYVALHNRYVVEIARNAATGKL